MTQAGCISLAIFTLVAKVSVAVQILHYHAVTWTVITKNTKDQMSYQ